MADLQKKYSEELIPKLEKELQITNRMAVPKLTKIVVNMGVKDAAVDSKLVDKMVIVLGTITGQKPKVTKSKKSIASFKLREGQPIGVAVTLRGKRMYAFLDRLISIVFPRIKDFRVIPRTGFDGRGNYALGFMEYAVFPEIDPGSVERMQGLEMVFVTTGKTDEEGVALLEAFGMPFKKQK